MNKHSKSVSRMHYALTFIPSVLFALAIICTQLPFLQVTDPISARTNWLNVVQVGPVDWSGDEGGFDIDNVVFPIWAAGLGIVSRLIPGMFNLSLCFAIQMIAGLMGGLIMFGFTNFTGKLFDDQYPVTGETVWPLVAALLLFLSAAVCLNLLIAWKKERSPRGSHLATG